jgi:hypothetical protein
VAPEEVPSAEWDDYMLLGLILFWIVGNFLFCFLSWRFGRGSGQQLAEELRRTRSKPTLAPDGLHLSPGSTALTVTRLPSHCVHFMRRASLFSPHSRPTSFAMTAGKITATWRQVWHLIHR